MVNWLEVVLVFVVLAVGGKHSGSVVVCKGSSHDTGFGIQVAATGDGIPREDVTCDCELHEGSLVLLRLYWLGCLLKVDAPLELAEKPMKGLPPLSGYPEHVLGIGYVIGEAMEGLGGLHDKEGVFDDNGVVVRVFGVHLLHFTKVSQGVGFKVALVGSV